MDYLIVYLEILLLTLIYTTVLFVNVRSEMGNAWEVNIFRAFLATMMLALVADAFTQAHYRGFLHLNPILVAFLYSFYMFMFSGVLPFLWFVFVEMRLGTGLLRNKKAVIISLIPLLIMSFMCFASMKTGWFFKIDEYGIYTRGPYWSLQVIVNYCYFMFTTIHALVVAHNEPSSLLRKQYYVLAMFLIAPFIGGLLQLYIGNHPFVAPATSIAMLFIFINIQGSLIHNDSLTGLYNRKSAEKYIEELKVKASDDTPFYLFKMGIDGFKEINDEHGYIEGDNVLKIVSKVLQKVTDKHSGLVARLGGVEFLSVIDGKHIKTAEAYEEAVKTAIKKEAKKQKLPYELKLDFGYTKCDSPEVKTSTLINLADREMYLSKNHEEIAE
jgi:diguanylate cyclase (GGDEF)-like protein